MSGLERSVANLCGAALAGIKPSSLAVCAEGARGELDALARAFSPKKIRIEQICVRDGRITFLVFREEKLRSHLEKAENVSFLARYGYPVGSLEKSLFFLRLRLAGNAFPHEVGVFLGYPKEDIEGYIEDPNGFLFCGAWKVYCKAEEKKLLFEKYRRCRDCIMRRLLRGESLAQIFR